MKRSFLLVIAGLLVVNAVLVTLDLAKPNPEAIRAKQLEGELSKAHTEHTGLKVEYEKLKEENDKLQVVVKASTKPAPVGALATAVPTVAIQPAGATGTTGATSGTSALDEAAKSAEALRKLTETPQVRDMMRKIRDGQIDTSYGGLFKKLGLNEEELNHFKQLLSDRQTKQNDIMMKRMPEGLTPEQRRAHSQNMAKETAAVKKQSDEAIHQFMDNEEDYQKFQQWEDTKGERLQVQMSLSSFDAADIPLSIEQRDKLMEVMVAVRKASQQPAASKAAAKTPGVDKAGALSLYKARQEANDQSIVQQAASFLSPEQIDVLQKTQLKRRELLSPLVTPAK